MFYSYPVELTRKINETGIPLLHNSGISFLEMDCDFDASRYQSILNFRSKLV